LKLTDDKLRFLQMARDNPLVFVEYCWGLKPDPTPALPQDNWQFDVMDAMAKGQRWVAIRSGHGVGKTTLLSWLLLWFASTRVNFKIPCTANTESQLQDVLFSEISKWWRTMPGWLKDRLDILGGYVRLKDDPRNSFAVARTAKKERPEALQGFHANNMLFICDEASGIDDIIFETGQGSLSTEDSYFILTGNPTRTDGYFRDAFGKNRKDFFIKQVNGEQVTRCSREYIARIIRQYGEDSDIYRVRVQGDFAQGNDDAYIPLHLIEAAVDRGVDRINVQPIWGVDPARYGKCASALSRRQGNHLIQPVQLLYKRSVTEVAGWVVKQFKDTESHQRPSYIVVDAIGIGAGVADILDEHLGHKCTVLAMNVSESSYTPDCLKLRDYLYKEAFEWFDSRTVSMPDDPALIADLSVIKGKYDSQGRLKIEGKDDLLARLHRSPDAGDSFVATFAVQNVRRSRKPKGKEDQVSDWTL